MKMKRRIIGVPLVLGSLIALFAMADAAMATHTVPIGASPFRVPLVPSFAACETASANSTHGAPLSFPSCNPPTLTSSTVKIGANAVGFARIVVSPTRSGALSIKRKRIKSSIIPTVPSQQKFPWIYANYGRSSIRTPETCTQ